MDRAIRREIDAIAGDRASSATALLPRAVALLRQAAASRDTLEAVARELSAAQPAMAGFRTACAIALQARDPADALDRFGERLERAPAAVARQAADLILLGHGRPDVRVVTCSRSRMVEAGLIALAARIPLTVCCAEGRPALEGRDLATALAGHGVVVHLFSDAGVSQAIRGADALVVGADGVSRDRFINKVGTAALCALASSEGVPVYVLTGREKIVRSGTLPDPGPQGLADEIWTSPDPRIIVLNPYFETVSMSLVSAVVTDGGVLDPVDVENAAII